MDLDQQTAALARHIDQLEQGPATLADWMAAEAEIGGALLAGHHLVTTLRRDMAGEVRATRAYAWAKSHSSVHGIVRLLDQLRMLRLRVQSRIFEHQVTTQQSVHMRFT